MALQQHLQTCCWTAPQRRLSSLHAEWHFNSTSRLAAGQRHKGDYPVFMLNGTSTAPPDLLLDSAAKATIQSSCWMALQQHLQTYCWTAPQRRLSSLHAGWRFNSTSRLAAGQRHKGDYPV